MHALAGRTAGAIARLLVLVLTLGTSVPFMAHSDEGHDPCDSGVISMAAGPSLHAPGAPVKPLHCDVCHWLRSLRAFDVVVAAPSAPVEGGWLPSSLGESPLSRLHVPAAPSRAPPA